MQSRSKYHVLAAVSMRTKFVHMNWWHCAHALTLTSCLLSWYRESSLSRSAQFLVYGGWQLERTFAPLVCKNSFNYLQTHHLTFGINPLLHSVNLIVFTLLLAHLILRISPYHSHHLRSHHLSLPPPFTPDLKPISFTNPFLHSHSYSFRTDFTDLNLYCIKGALALFVLFFVSGYVC